MHQRNGKVHWLKDGSTEPHSANMRGAAAARFEAATCPSTSALISMPSTPALRSQHFRRAGALPVANGARLLHRQDTGLTLSPRSDILRCMRWHLQLTRALV